MGFTKEEKLEKIKEYSEVSYSAFAKNDNDHIYQLHGRKSEYNSINILINSLRYSNSNIDELIKTNSIIFVKNEKTVKTSIVEQENFEPVVIKKNIYSKNKFEGYVVRFKVEFNTQKPYVRNLDIYSNNPNEEDLKKYIFDNMNSSVKSFAITHKATKEQDEADDKFLDEFLKDF